MTRSVSPQSSLITQKRTCYYLVTSTQESNQGNSFSSVGASIMMRSQNKMVCRVQLLGSADPVAIPTRRHARSREPRPAHRRRRRRGSYCAPLPPRLNPSPNPWTMASSKLLSSNGSNPSEEAEAKTCSTTTNNTKSHQITARSS